MAETSKNKIYYNDDENSAADVLADMKKLAQSTDDAIEKSKYNDTQIKKDILNMKTEIAAKDNEQDNKILQLQTEKAEREKELKEAQEDFYQNSIRGQARGEYIHVEDSSNCRAKIGINGNSEQETRSGKNMLELIEGTYSNNGITAVVKNGIVTLNGTATGTSFVEINLLKSIELTNDKVYHVSAFNEKTVGNSTNYCSLRLIQANIQVLFNTANANGSITTNLEIPYITIRTSQGITYNNFVVKPQLELGAGTNEWEQGGVSPSPDYPSEVECCGDNINLFDKNDITNNTSIDVKNGNTYTNNNSFSTNFIKINGITELCCNGLSDTSKLWGAIYDENKSYIKGINTTNGIFNETNLSGATYIRLGLLKTYLDTMKLEKGKVATPYSTYGQGCINEVVFNIQMFNKANEIVGQLINSSGVVSTNENWNTSEYISVKKGSTICWSYETVGAGQLTINEFNDAKSFIKQTYADYRNNNGNELVVTLSNDTSYVRVGYRNNLTCDNLVLEYGNKRSGSREYKESQTYTIPTQREMLEGDYFDFDNEEEVHTWNKLVLNGTESWTYNSIENLFYIILENSDLSVSSNIHCTHFKSVLYNVVSNENNCITASGIMLILKKNDISNLEDFISYLKSQYDARTPVVIYYKLATPEKLAFTDEQKAVAKELNNARTYKNVTNITTDSKAILSLDYAKDLETLLNNTQALAVNNASEGV